MMVSLSYESRRFQVWSYSVSHSQLLIRSVKEGSHDTVVDVLFKGVSFLQLHTWLDGLVIVEVEPSASNCPEMAAEGRRVFEVRTRDTCGHVVAGSVWHTEFDGSHGDPSPLIPRFPP